MRVLLGQGYYLRLDAKAWAARQPYPPLGTLYAAAVLRARGFEVALFDAVLAGSVEEWTEALDRHLPGVCVLYEDSFNYLSKMCLGTMRRASLVMIAAARDRGVRVLVCGSDATDHPEVYLDAGAEAVILGEGEGTLGEAVDALAGPPARLEDVDGLCFRGADGRLVRTAARPPLREIDALPRPAWDLVDVDAYRRIWRARHRYFSMNLVTTRGCPYHCNWCAKPIWGQRYAVRSAEAVADEVRWLKDAHAPDHLWFCDDIFGLSAGWVERYADALVERHAVVPFKCLSRADLLEEPVVRALARAGCRTVWMGAESGSQRILDAMEKGLTVEQIVGAARRLHAAGIEVGLFLQFGYPGEEWDDVERTLDLVRACSPDDIGISVSYPLPGTKFYDRVKADLGDKTHWEDSDELAMMFEGAFTTPFYRRLHRYVHAQFRLARLRRAGARRLGARAALGAVAGALALPVHRAALRRLSRGRARPALFAPVLSRQAAARPTEPVS